jgi:hypothetical protein
VLGRARMCLGRAGGLTAGAMAPPIFAGPTRQVRKAREQLALPWPLGHAIERLADRPHPVALGRHARMALVGRFFLCSRSL